MRNYKPFLRFQQQQQQQQKQMQIFLMPLCEQIFEVDKRDAGDTIALSVPRDLADGFINNKKEEYKFRFEKIFATDALQEDIFESVAEPVIEK